MMITMNPTKGVLFIKLAGDKNEGTSINYEKSGTTYADSKLKYEVRTMRLDSLLLLIYLKKMVQLTTRELMKEQITIQWKALVTLHLISTLHHTLGR